MSKAIIDVREYQTHGKKCKLYEFPFNFVIIDNSKFNNLCITFALFSLSLGISYKILEFIKKQNKVNK